MRILFLLDLTNLELRSRKDDDLGLLREEKRLL